MTWLGDGLLGWTAVLLRSYPMCNAMVIRDLRNLLMPLNLGIKNPLREMYLHYVQYSSLYPMVRTIKGASDVCDCRTHLFARALNCTNFSLENPSLISR